jgi:hypothetical protein
LLTIKDVKLFEGIIIGMKIVNCFNQTNY